MGTLTKNAKDHIPYCADQGMPNLVAASASGISIQSFQALMPADGVFVFAEQGLSDMETAAYLVLIHNHTGTTQGTVDNADRTVSQITVTGPTTSDVLDIVIVGQLKGQLA
jgi:hypothetical protein